MTPIVALAIALAVGAAIAALPATRLRREPPPAAPDPVVARTPRAPVPTAELPDPLPTPEEVRDEPDNIRSRWLRECSQRGGHRCCGQGGCCGLADTWIAPHVTTYFPAVTGDVPTAMIETILDAQGGAIDRCYERAHLEPGGVPYLAFRMLLHADEAPSVAIEGFDGEVADCVADVLLHAPFPRPAQGTVTVTSSFTIVE